MSIPYDVTFEQDQLDRADTLPDWGDVIPFDGAPAPAGTDAAGMDAEAGVPFAEWLSIYSEEPWTLEPEWSRWEEAA
jgi:hypothetical protein